MLRKIFGWFFGSGGSRSDDVMDKFGEAEDFDLGLDQVAEIGKGSKKATTKKKLSKVKKKKTAKKKSKKNKKTSPGKKKKPSRKKKPAKKRSKKKK
jgi:hypothetical protein